MNTVTRPIVATTSLSIVLHGVVFAAVMLLYGQAATLVEGMGRSVDIHLISSIMISDQQETELPGKQEAVPIAQEPVPKNLADTVHNNSFQNILTSLNSAEAVMLKEPVEKKLTEQKHVIQQVLPVVNESESIAQIKQSTNASQQHHSILELLHSSISNYKEYPYLARRQRREGVATVSFVLHPDGTIKNAHLVSSSSTGMLDRAALSAVKRIEPFRAARDYLDQAEEFKIDVVFNLL